MSGGERVEGFRGECLGILYQRRECWMQLRKVFSEKEAEKCWYY